MTTSLPFRFGVNQFTIWPWSFEQDVENYARLSVNTIEVCESKLDEDRAADQLALVEHQGLTIGSFQPAVRTLFPSQTQPEPEDPQDRTAQFRRTIERLGGFARGSLLSATPVRHRTGISGRSSPWPHGSTGSWRTSPRSTGRSLPWSP